MGRRPEWGQPITAFIIQIAANRRFDADLRNNPLTPHRSEYEIGRRLLKIRQPYSDPPPEPGPRVRNRRRPAVVGPNEIRDTT